jgi:DNA end-binding protein Ku
VDTNKREVDMARQLIESLAADFDPSKYKDTYRERVLELIERKAEGKEIAVQPVEEPQPVPDLMAALEASVNAARQNRETGGRPSGNGASAEPEAKAKPKAKPKAKAAAAKPKSKAKAKS